MGNNKKKDLSFQSLSTSLGKPCGRAGDMGHMVQCGGGGAPGPV